MDDLSEAVSRIALAAKDREGFKDFIHSGRLA
jgi:hypothetical protein